MEIWPVTPSQERFAVAILVIALVMVPAAMLPGPVGPWIFFAIGVLFAALIVFDTWVRPQLFPERELNDEQRFGLAMQAWINRQSELDGDRIKALERDNVKLREEYGRLAATYETLKGDLAALKAPPAPTPGAP